MPFRDSAADGVKAIEKIRDTYPERDGGDLLGFPLIGTVVRSGPFFTSLQTVNLVMFCVAIYRGYVRPDIKNNLFTTGLFWGLFWPLFIFVTTPTLGKVICAVCPHRLLIFRLTAPFSRNRKPPSWMTGGYLSLAFVMLFYWFVVYSWPGIFKNPWNTALFFTVFTVTAILVSLIFRPNTWCKGICPVAIPTNLVSRMAFLGISTYRPACDVCRKATCVSGRPGYDGCPHGLIPFRLDDNSDCTLCMKCVNACSHDAVRFGFLKPLREFERKKLKPDMPESFGVVLLLGAITFTMMFAKGLSHGPLKDMSPFVTMGNVVYPYISYFISREGAVALTTFLFGILFSTGYCLFFSLYAGKLAGKGAREAFGVMAWSMLPVFALSSFAQMCEFFPFRYYPMISDGFLDLFGYGYRAKPLVDMHSLSLLSFKAISIGGSVWSLIFTWRLSGKLSDIRKTRIKISFPFWILIGLIMIGFIGQIAAMLFMDMPGLTGPRF